MALNTTVKSELESLVKQVEWAGHNAQNARVFEAKLKALLKTVKRDAERMESFYK